MHKPTRSNPKPGCFSCGSPPLFGWSASEETKPSTLIFDSKVGRTLVSSSVNADQKELTDWRQFNRGPARNPRIVVSGYNTCTNANRDSRPRGQRAGRIHGVFFICAIIPEHESVVREVVFTEQPGYAGFQAARRCSSPSALLDGRRRAVSRIFPSLVTSSKRTETCFETPDSCMVTP